MPQQVIDRYQLKGVLGRGAMGHVYAAWDPKLQREVALKLVVKAQSTDPKTRERFHREVCAIAALRHPNIVEIYDYSGVQSEHLYYIMEKLEGDDLFNVLQSRGAMPETVVAAIGHELCLALELAHENGVIHRDLKPENVFINAAGRVVLTDFGVVKAVREDSAVPGFSSHTDIIGTPGFMPPELLTGKQLGPYTDLFALGVTLYNLLTGELPFNGSSPVQVHRAIVNGEAADPRKVNARVSDELCDTLMQCLAARPKDRPQSAEEVRKTLKAVLDINGVSDVREDLRDYMKDSHAYAAQSFERCRRRLLERMKVAIKDKDSATAALLHRRLLQIDPGNEEAENITGLIKVAKARAGSWRPRRGASPLVYVGAAAVAGIALGLAAVFAWRNRDIADEELTRVTPPPVAATVDGKLAEGGRAATAAKTGTLAVRVRNGPADVVTVAGQRLSKADQRGKRFNPGRYRVEVSGRGKKLGLDVELRSAGRVVVTADLKKGRISAN